MLPRLLDHHYGQGISELNLRTSLDQPAGAAFGAQASFNKLSLIVKDDGFGQVRKATETPVNMILEAR